MLVEDTFKADGEAHEPFLAELYFGRARKDMLKVQLLRIMRKKSDVARGFNDTA